MTRPKKSLSDMIKTEVKSGEQSQEKVISSTPDAPVLELSLAPVSVQTNPNQVIELETELETQKKLVNKLQTELKQAKHNEDDLEAQKNLVNQLSSQLETAQALKTELEEQKELIKRLYSELQKTETIQSELEEQKQLVENLYIQLQAAQANSTQAVLPKDSSPQQQSSLVKKTSSQMRYSRPIGRYIDSNKTNSELSNDDIGWFD